MISSPGSSASRWARIVVLLTAMLAVAWAAGPTASGKTSAFPAGTVIRDDQQIRGYSGPGVDGKTVLFWGRNRGA
jgi:hypothetical protein